MSNSKTAIAEIKKLMKQFGFMSDESVLKSFKLEDNTILQTSDLKIGENISKINEAFEQVALEDGSYRLVENFNIEVKDGKIVLEKYFGTFTKDSLWYWASAGKTLTAFLVGKAQDEKFQMPLITF